ncbi:nitroreductase family protein [Dyella psychrodurans]|uniref:Nitroreductase family protein n=1 Tax=Dyella psychrodurans TaxID=1927960 RepID=A0A370WV13_9GAMM|nr:nitroreductase family protein [Dyella psychrodurans]RDS79983.1 nitroreductase family protein [Dyella psychrodurans]
MDTLLAKAPAPATESTAAAWVVFRAINAYRRAVRDFDGSPVADEDVRAVLAEAQLAPSSNNLQPYRFHWIKDPSLKGEVAAACHNQRAAANASALIVVVASSISRKRSLDGLAKHVESCPALSEASKTYHRAHLKTLRRFGYIGELPLWTPLMALASWIDPIWMLLPLGHSCTRHWMARNSLFAAQTLLLAAAAKGLDSCPMEGFHARKVARLLKLPRGAVIPLVIALGRRTPDARIEPRWRVPFDAAVVEH